jgi:hypothetical protein
MKKILFASLISSSLLATFAAAENNEICNTPLYKQIVKSEKQDYRRPNIKPSRSLSEMMVDFELLCPLQVEKDFNGDKRLDWFGVLEQNGRFYLMLYLSTPTTHKFQQVKEFKSAPNNQYFDVTDQKRLYDVAGHFEFRPEIKFAAVENRMDGTAIAYLWDGTQMKQLVEFKWPLEKEDT